MNELALFAGAGGGILGGLLCGFRTICAVEHDAYARDVLVARQNDGCLEAFPIWDDVCTFDGHAWRGRVDVVSGGFPCQDISAAGKGAGITGERSGLWREMARIIGEVLPRFVLVENSPMLVGRGLGLVLGDLAAMGYDAQWGVVGAMHAGAPHRRERIWIVGSNLSNAEHDGLHGNREDESKRQREEVGWRELARRNGGDGDVADREGCGRGTGRARGSDSGGARERELALQAVADASRPRLQGSEQPGTLRDERHGTQAHESTGECGGLPGSSLPNAYGLNGDYGRHGASPVCGQQGQQPSELSGSESPELCHATSEGLPHGATEQMGEPGADAQSERSNWWATEPDVGGKTNGMATKLDGGKAHD